MPYFIRQPYPRIAASRGNGDSSAETDILELAQNVLASETGDGVTRPFRIRDALRPGGFGAMVLELALERASPACTINLAASDLIGAGSWIGSKAVRISPPTLTFSTSAPADVTVTVQAPSEARPGLYAGTVSATGDETFAIPFQVEVR
jgi:hypothetical protein